MPSPTHELLVELFTQTPALADLLRLLGKRAPPRAATSHPNFSESKAVEIRTDAFFTVGDPAAPRSWLILEVQTSIDRRKLGSIPLSAELAWARYPKAAGDVVVVTAGEEVARFFDREPLRRDGPLGTRRQLEVVRLDLSRVPRELLFDPRRPQLALLAVAAHRATEAGRAVAAEAMEITLRVGKYRGAGRRHRLPALNRWVADAILATVDAAMRRELLQMFQRRGYRSDYFRGIFAEGEARGEARGKAEGKAEAILRVLERRELAMSDALRARVAGETDLERLDAWLDAAATAERIEDVFGDDEV
jgi:hypothetical protein